MKHLQRKEKNNHARQLPNAVKLYPTPTSRNGTGISQTKTTKGGLDLQTFAHLYPTTTAGKLCGGTENQKQLEKMKADRSLSPEEYQSMVSGNGGKLNPDWVETMMGFPIGWTQLEKDGD